MRNYEKEFIQLFNKIAPQYRRSSVFLDFITLSAIEFYQATYGANADADLIARFKHSRARYDNEEFLKLAQLLSIVINALTEKPYDFLGTVFMALELGDNYKGQYFTPSYIGDLMAKVVLQDCDSTINRKGYITFSEPCCGSGVMVIGCVNTLYEYGFNPQKQFCVHCQDVDFTAAMMCYIQLSLLHIPACIVVGDTLCDEQRICIYTLAYVMGDWSSKWALSDIQNKAEAEIVDAEEWIETESTLKPSFFPAIVGEEEVLDEDEVIFY